MKHIKTYEKFQLVDETYQILEGKVSREELTNIINEGFFGFLRGLFVDNKTKRALDKLADDLFKTKVELMKLEIQEDQVDAFKDELKAAEQGQDYSSQQGELDTTDLDRIKEMKIKSLQDRETAISDEMDNLGQISDKLQRYVEKIKLDVRMKATDATIKIADDEIARILQKLKREDQKQSQQIDRELR